TPRGPRRRGPRGLRQPAAVLAMRTAAAVVLAAVGSGCQKPDAGVPPTPPGSAGPAQPAGPAPRSSAPNLVTPERAADLRRVRWHRAEAVPARNEVRIHATLEGGPPCTVLG